MSLTCTRCEGSGFLHLSQLDDRPEISHMIVEDILRYINDPDNETGDVQVCDCCGDGEAWYGVPGEHYNSEDPEGSDGPYASNGGLCHCH